MYQSCAGSAPENNAPWQEALESEEPDDVPLLPFSPPPPGAIRPPYRGLSITIPPEYEDLPEMCVDPMLTSSGGGLNIRIYQVLFAPLHRYPSKYLQAGSGRMLCWQLPDWIQVSGSLQHVPKLMVVIILPWAAPVVDAVHTQGMAISSVEDASKVPYSCNDFRSQSILFK